MFQENKARQIFQKTNISYPATKISYPRAHQRVRNVCLSESFLETPDLRFALFPYYRRFCFWFCYSEVFILIFRYLISANELTARGLFWTWVLFQKCYFLAVRPFWWELNVLAILQNFNCYVCWKLSSRMPQWGSTKFETTHLRKEPIISRLFYCLSDIISYWNEMQKQKHFLKKRRSSFISKIRYANPRFS